MQVALSQAWLPIKQCRSLTHENNPSDHQEVGARRRQRRSSRDHVPLSVEPAIACGAAQRWVYLPLLVGVFQPGGVPDVQPPALSEVIRLPNNLAAALAGRLSGRGGVAGAQHPCAHVEIAGYRPPAIRDTQGHLPCQRRVWNRPAAFCG